MDELERASGVSKEQMAMIDEVDLYGRLGQSVLVRLSTAFYDRVYDDDQAWFRDIFAGADKAEAIRNQWEWLVQRVGGPPLYQTRKGHPGLMRRHATFAVTEAAAVRWMEHMGAAMASIPEIDADSAMRLTFFLRRMAFFLAAGLSKPGGPAHAHVTAHANAAHAAAAAANDRPRPTAVDGVRDGAQLPPHLATMASELTRGEAQLVDVREAYEAAAGTSTLRSCHSPRTTVCSPPSALLMTWQASSSSRRSCRSPSCAQAARRARSTRRVRPTSTARPACAFSPQRR
jgi:truncated hemoglobin YjbI